MNELLDKYFSKERTPKEQEILFATLDKDEELKAEFARVQNLMSSIAYYRDEECDDFVSEGWNNLQKRRRRKNRKRFLITISKYAAVACLTLGLSWFIFGSNTPKKDFTEIMSPEGQRTRIVLNDGSEVWLSPLSKLKIPTPFDRRVELEGEGFFTVAHNQGKPFIVNTHTYDIKVLGTKFNVFAYSHHPRFEVNLLEGSVFVYNRTSESDSLHLAPQEKVVSSTNNHLIKSKSEYIEERYIKEGIFYFQSIPISLIMEYLSLWYDIEFKMENNVELSNVKVSGKIRQSDRVDHIMKAILASSDSGYKFKMINDKLVYIYK
ncbi:anti-sigma factor [Bacteroidia bacterium]|nr:anti-sigma factor [Bacteroidia bacterium]GHV38784.1 anti-sigma factor [Bacteroidia bacterium]